MRIDQDRELELIRKLKEQDEQAFSHLYNLYVKRIYAFVLSILKSPVLTEDVVQDTFVKLWESTAFLQTDRSLLPFLFTIARNTSLNMIRRASRETWITDEIAMYSIDLAEDAHQYTQRKQTSGFIIDAINQLPPQRKLIYDMCRNDGYSYKQAAEKLGISSSTVNSQMVKAIKFIKAYMIRHGALFLLLLIKK
ncbi:RNA polymerase sigma-70 factor, ECF subfamily [Mucilaginibacter pineti]|uniref:RNA polymerase sigma-70 factor, ECF subfamily n=1 Tax=Mucilaginibacter pineti TaxID=1391627 RepID=A0A1G6ZLD9_9SPHI|nr:RNA polymerase sigma-70 factor [Mucilaginibacter pineti]SDE03243.1 RNA polymerase sigma-70 factor, ECF subfamily [Mucilaginibacter pineti]